jgi:hypothetical protein
VQSHLYIFQNRHGIEEADVLKSPGDAPGNDLVAVQAIEYFTIVGNGSFGWFVHTGDQVKHRCLSSTVGADQAQNFPTGYLEIQVVDSQQPAKFHGNIFQ